MKNCNIDSRGHIISYENDHGDTITDYKQLSENLGLNKSTSSSYSRSTSSGGSEPGNPPGLLAVATSIMLLICLGVLILIWYLVIAKDWRVVTGLILSAIDIGWAVFIFIIAASDINLTITNAKKAKEKKRRKRHNIEEVKHCGSKRCY